MAATQMSKTFLGASIKSAVPVQGKASRALWLCKGTFDVHLIALRECMLCLASKVGSIPHYATAGPTGFLLNRLQGNKQVTRAAVEFYGPNRAKFLGESLCLPKHRQQSA